MTSLRIKLGVALYAVGGISDMVHFNRRERRLFEDPSQRDIRWIVSMMRAVTWPIYVPARVEDHYVNWQQRRDLEARLARQRASQK